MTRHSTAQTGFAAIEAVLVLVIVGIIGGTGYFVWHAKQNTDASLANSASTTPAISKSSKESVANASKDTASSSSNTNTVYDTSAWSTTGIGDMLLFSVPDGWKVFNQDKGFVYAETATALSYKPGTRATIEKTSGAKDGSFRFYVSTSSTAPDVRDYQKVGDFKAKMFTGSKYTHTISGKEESGMGATNGTVEYMYVFPLRDGSYASFGYDIYPGDPDNLTVVEAAVASATYQGE